MQNTTSNSIQIIWRTAMPGSTFVQYGTNSILENLYTNAAPVAQHVASLTGLLPDSRYFYRVGVDSSVSSTATFRTFKCGGPITFMVMGDSFGGPQTLTNALLAVDADLVMHLGDVVGGGYDDQVFDSAFFSPFRQHIQSTPYFFAMGNHDYGVGYSPTNSTNWQNAFFLPTNSIDGTELFYSFDHGDAHFVVLTETLEPMKDPWIHYEWLLPDLANSHKPWKFIFRHAPTESCGTYARVDYSMVLPMAQTNGVQAIFGSHDHDLQRFAPTNGVHSIVTGGGGTSLYHFNTSGASYIPYSALSQFWSLYHFLKISITNDILLLEAIDRQGAIFDRMSIRTGLPSRQLYQASWNTVSVATAPADDGDGNITGQTFGFIGAPIYPRAGQFSNLGRVYVNNDSTNLYIGLEQVMMYRGNNMFLFIESPRLDGVTTMSGLGNGTIDPDSEGADGLDCLENLSFSNFTPSVGCILGDEFADGQFRSFVRSNLSLNIGQGVFRLTNTLPDLPGVRLQQFNRSPNQIPLVESGVTWEQNADCIELAIPYSELGGLRPGDIIKIAALIGGGAFDPVSQTRQLDTSVLGYSLSGSGLSNVVLEGVSVQLAPAPHPAIEISIAPVGIQQYRLTWNSLPGRLYDIEYALSLTNFIRLEDPRLPITATDTNQSFSLSAPDHACFYRIRLVP